jgi:hypothetical protein
MFNLQLKNSFLTEVFGLIQLCYFLFSLINLKKMKYLKNFLTYFGYATKQASN